VPVLLDPTSTNYTRWRDQVLLTLKRYALTDHVLSDAASPCTPAWERMDSVVISWLFGTTTSELQEIIREHHGTAHQSWLALENHFIGNRETHALHLDTTFRNFVQGDLSVHEYCRKMKGFADMLADLDAAVSDHILVLTILRGLNKKFEHLRSIITRTVPFPSFQKIRDDLILEELPHGCRSLWCSLFALYTNSAPLAPASTTSSSQGGQGRSPGTGGQGEQSGSSNNNNRKRNRNRRGGGSNGGGGNGGGSNRNNGSNSFNKNSAPWLSLYNPWTGSITMWPSPGGQQLQRPPLPHQQQAFLASGGLPRQVGPPFTPPLAPLPAAPTPSFPGTPTAPKWSPWDAH
jgi:uncharacterized membrane protein YgcG